ADAGDTEGEPVAEASTLDDRVELTPELVAELRDAGVNNVRVKKFSFARWRGAWWFIGSAVGLVGGALLVRRETAREIAAMRDAEDADTLSPSVAVGVIRDTLADLSRVIDDTPNAERQNAAIVASLGELQQTAVPAIVEARTRLVAEMGLGRYAQFMDSFSACERQINRAWSAAADGVAEEATWCVFRAQELLEEVESKLPEPPPPSKLAPATTPALSESPPPIGAAIATTGSAATGLAATGSAATGSAATGAGIAMADPTPLSDLQPDPQPDPGPQSPAPETGDDPLAEIGIEFRKESRRPTGVDPYSVEELASESDAPSSDDEDDEGPQGGPKLEF
ncbi:MAG: hypothetical protein AAGK04_13475, partial [Planctomycetota bacterium]